MAVLLCLLRPGGNQHDREGPCIIKIHRYGTTIGHTRQAILITIYIMNSPIDNNELLAHHPYLSDPAHILEPLRSADKFKKAHAEYVCL